MATSSPIEVRTITSELISLCVSGEKSPQLTGVFLLGTEKALDLFTNLTLRHLNIILGFAIVGHEGQEAIVRDIKLDADISIGMLIVVGVSGNLQAEVPDERRLEHPCCG